jgi:hypothetical protein
MRVVSDQIMAFTYRFEWRVHEVTLSLSIIMITRWRKNVYGSQKLPLLDTLWNDGTYRFLAHISGHLRLWIKD